jgi:hypothetical protein
MTRNVCTDGIFLKIFNASLVEPVEVELLDVED